MACPCPGKGGDGTLLLQGRDSGDWHSVSGIPVTVEGDGQGWQSQLKAWGLQGTLSLRSHCSCGGLAVALLPVQLEKTNSGSWKGWGEPFIISAKWHLPRSWGGCEGGGGPGTGAAGLCTPWRITCVSRGYGSG